jgi:hypothetical protein
VELDGLEIREPRIEILDLYDDEKLVAAIEIVSPANKLAGPGRKSYLDMQRELLERDVNLIEIDLLRKSRHVMTVPRWRVLQFRPYDYLVCVNRHPTRHRFELYPRTLRQRLPRIRVPLAAPDPDVPLDIQDAFEHIHADGRYMWRIRYHEPCIPPLRVEEQQWANKRLAAYRAAHPDAIRPAAPREGGKRGGKKRRKS